MDLELGGKTFIVTGGTDGLGLATVQTLLDEGANVLASGRSEGRLEEVRAGLGDAADRIAHHLGDNADAALPGELGKAVFDRWGRLDGLLVSVGGPPSGRVLGTADDTWREAFETVFLGTVRLVRDLAPMIADGGSIVLILAISAKEASAIMPISNGLRPGLAMLVKSFAEELGPRNIRVNALLPNLFATERTKRVLDGGEAPVGNIALRRMGEPVELARIATLLLSRVSSYVTGAAVSIDGGQLKSL